MLNYFNIRDINHFILTARKVKVDYDLLECSIGMNRNICSRVDTVGSAEECNSSEFCTTELWDLNNCYED